MIRAYEQEDQEQVEHCIVELQNFERSIEPNRVEGTTVARRYLSDLLHACSEKTGQIFVAEVNDEVVGFICIWLEHEPAEYLTSLTDYAYISDLVVLPGYRGLGLGPALIEKAEMFAIQQGATVVQINVLAKNTVAMNVYRKAGFQDYELALLKHLLSTNERGSL